MQHIPRETRSPANIDFQRSRQEPDPDAMAVDKEEVALQSGSEEGEIEEV